MAIYEDLDEDYFAANYDAGAERMKEEQRSKVCPECDGTNLTEDKTRCWDCDGGPG